MVIHEVSEIHSHRHFGGNLPPALRVEQGEPFTLAARSILGEGRTSLPTCYEDLVIPVTGPVAIAGVRAGDTIRVDIIDITIADVGAMVTFPGYGLFGDEIKFGGKIFSITDGMINFAPGIQIPVLPMVGKLGIGVPDNPPISSTVGHFGGNMDNKFLGIGSSIYLQSIVDEGLLYAGDLHACQGDGEVSLTALEVAGKVTLKVQVVPPLPVSLPVVVSADLTMTIGDGMDMESAVRNAARAMATLLSQSNDWSFETTVMALSLIGDVGVCQLVNPRVSGKVSVASKYVMDLNHWLSPCQKD